MAYILSAIALLASVTEVSAAAVSPRFSLASLAGYAPVPAICPSSALVRPATSASSSEESYISSRQTKASAALKSWLEKVNSDFDTSEVPILGLTTSGGGYRSLLNGAGVVQAFDARDSSSDVSGLYQSLAYQAGLSGGGWLLSSIAGNNWPTISTLKTSLWETAFQDSLLDPGELLAAAAYTEIVLDISAKNAAGFEPTIVDPYGRLLSYQLLQGTDGGVSDTMSGLASNANFTSFNVPFPIITAIGDSPGQCTPLNNNTQYEFSPYEFGSWDAEVKAFVQTAYLGSHLSNGKPVTTGVCVKNYDNLGYVLGTSSNIFAAVCEAIPAVNSTSNLAETLENIVSVTHDPAFRDIYATYPNPFANYSGSPSVSSQTELDLVDGGLSNQNNPIWPFIQTERNLSVLIVNDNSADTSDNFPNGTEIYNTHVQAQSRGLKKMPRVPPPSTFVSEGLNKRAVFFGCNETSALTIVWLPNVNYTYASNTSTAQVVYSKDETDGIIDNGNAIATQNSTEGWPTCLGCAIQMKTGATLPAACDDCFSKYCYSS